MTKEDHLEWIDSKILTERSINTAKKLKNHWSKEDQKAFINQLSIINWVLESAFIIDSYDYRIPLINPFYRLKG